MSASSPSLATDGPATGQIEALASRYARLRARSIALASPLSAEDCGAQSMPDASPVKWHLAHITVVPRPDPNALEYLGTVYAKKTGFIKALENLLMARFSSAYGLPIYARVKKFAITQGWRMHYVSSRVVKLKLRRKVGEDISHHSRYMVVCGG